MNASEDAATLFPDLVEPTVLSAALGSFVCLSLGYWLFGMFTAKPLAWSWSGYITPAKGKNPRVTTHHRNLSS